MQSQSLFLFFFSELASILNNYLGHQQNLIEFLPMASYKPQLHHYPQLQGTPPLQQVPPQFQIHIPRNSWITNNNQQGERIAPIQKHNQQNRILINNSEVHTNPIDININIRVNEDGNISAQVLPSSHRSRIYSPKPINIERQTNEASYYSRINNYSPNYRNFSMNSGPSPQSKLSSHNFICSPSNLPTQQTQVFCVICQTYYTLQQAEQHKQKHVRGSHTDKKVPKFAKLKQKYTNSFITRTIVEPQSFNISYRPNKFILEQQLKEKQVQTRKNKGDDDLDSELRVNPELMHSVTKKIKPDHISTPIQIQLDESRFSKISGLSDDSPKRTAFKTLRKIKKEDNVLFSNVNNLIISRDSLVSDKNSQAERPEYQNNRDTLQVQQSLLFQGTFSKNYSSNNNELIRESYSKEEQIAIILQKQSQKSQRIDLESDNESMSRYIKHVQGKYNAVYSRKVIGETPSFNKPQSSDKNIDQEIVNRSKSKKDSERNSENEKSLKNNSHLSSVRRSKNIEKSLSHSQSSKRLQANQSHQIGNKSVAKMMVVDQCDDRKRSSPQSSSSIQNSSQNKRSISQSARSSSQKKESKESSKQMSQNKLMQVGQKKISIAGVRNNVINPSGSLARKNKFSYSQKSTPHNDVEQSEIDEPEAVWNRLLKTQPNQELSMKTNKQKQQIENASSEFGQLCNMKKKQTEQYAYERSNHRNGVNSEKNRSIEQRSESRKKRIPKALITGYY